MGWEDRVRQSWGGRKGERRQNDRGRWGELRMTQGRLIVVSWQGSRVKEWNWGEKTKGNEGRQEGTGSYWTNGKEEEKKGRIQKDIEKRDGGREESRARERESELCALLTLPSSLPVPALDLALGKHQAKACLWEAGPDHLSPPLPSKPGWTCIDLSQIWDS